MAAVASLPEVQRAVVDQASAPRRSENDEASVSLCRTGDAAVAEHLRALLALFEIRAAVVQRDPLGMGLAIAEIFVLAADHARAAAILENEKSPVPEEWHCFNCGEFVPGNFDVCWNCFEPCGDGIPVPSVVDARKDAVTEPHRNR